MAPKPSPITAPPPTAAPNAPAPEKPAVAKRKSSLSTVALIVVVAGVGAGGGIWFIQGRASTAASTSPEKPAETLVHLEGFTVNLADPEENHFLRVTMDLSVTHLPPALQKDKPYSGLPVPRIRDTILSVLTAGKADVLLTSEGKQQLKKDLLAALNRQNPELGVRDIYFTEFLVQR